MSVVQKLALQACTLSNLMLQRTALCWHIHDAQHILLKALAEAGAGL